MLEYLLVWVSEGGGGGGGGSSCSIERRLCDMKTSHSTHQVLLEQINTCMFAISRDSFVQGAYCKEKFKMEVPKVSLFWNKLMQVELG